MPVGRPDDIPFDTVTLECEGIGARSHDKKRGGLLDNKRNRHRVVAPPPLQDMYLESPRKPHWPWFCMIAILGCSAYFVMEMQENGWEFQPFSCPRQCPNGRPCNEDGSPCEANTLLGPTMAVMDRLGAKNDEAIFHRNEWWRIVTCNWMHGGLIHLVLNMMAVLQLGVSLERSFGFWRVGVLYILSGLFGTMVSVIFLPGVISVGASASVFGLVGSCWSDVIQNYCARCTLQGSGFFSLLILTVINMCIGLTPLVDNFMHVGGFVAGMVVGLTLFSKKHVDVSGRRTYTCMQREIVFFSSILVLLLVLVSVAAALSKDVQEFFRSCTFCENINCVEIELFTTKPWWSCCIAKVPGECALTDNVTFVIAQCNMTNAPPFEMFCPRSDPECAYDAEDGGTISHLCSRLCSSC
mmetsp:Transcript_18540/g.30997  ORF Transcript_18540/g.30997 Transcript_18540/m.30997 type:complete len:411 (+) Transcript_18540:199-1431(+)